MPLFIPGVKPYPSTVWKIETAIPEKSCAPLPPFLGPKVAPLPLLVTGSVRHQLSNTEFARAFETAACDHVYLPDATSTFHQTHLNVLRRIPQQNLIHEYLNITS